MSVQMGFDGYQASHDVCPRNIIFEPPTDSSGGRYVLIDWGCSVWGRGQKATGFRGSLAFAHQAVHQKENKQPWKPEEDHDKASLCFTICALHKGVPVPWRGFYQRNPDRACFEDRREQTKDSFKKLCLENLGLEKLGWMNLGLGRSRGSRMSVMLGLLNSKLAEA